MRVVLLGHFNYFLYLVIFLGFFHPHNSELGISIFGSVLSFNVIAIVAALFINLFCSSRNSSSIVDKETRLILAFLFVYIFALEFFIKTTVLNAELSDGLKSIRVGLFGLCVMAFCLTGFQCNVEKLWKVFLLSLAASFLLSLTEALPFIDIPTVEYSDEGSYRMKSSNASFGVIGFFYFLFKDKMNFCRSKLLDFVSALSIACLLLTFNRTYLISLVIVLLFFLFFSDIKLRIRTVKVLSVLTVGIIVLYFSNELFKGLFESRVMSLVSGSVSVADPGSIGGRALIYEGVVERVSQGYWLLGLPYSEPIFVWPGELINGTSKTMARTDTTFINVLLRYGVITLFLYLIYLYRTFGRKKPIYFRMVFLCYAVASVNVDSLFLQNSFFFLCLFLFFIRVREKQTDLNVRGDYA